MKIGVVGGAGRGGKLLVAEVLGTQGCVLAAGSERPGHPDLGKDIGLVAGVGALKLAIGDDASAVFAAADIAIDFTAPAATLGHAELAAQAGKALVVGTTGMDEAQMKALARAGARCVVVRAANMSVGVNLLLGLTRQVASILGPDYDIEIVEMHHRHKVDAPSGTALALGEAAAEGRRVRLADVAQRVRDGKATLDDLRGGTFTITNMGALGGTGAIPIINYPEVAILGVARAREEAVVYDGQIRPRLMLPLTLTFDHRVADGADGARFASDLVSRLQHPDQLLLDL
jgi:4-hydroxy-tetrahydrodipicolinate reductase